MGVTVRLLQQVGERYIEVATVEFDALPIEKEYDYRCDNNLLRFEEARVLSEAVAKGDVEGNIGVYHWRK